MLFIGSVSVSPTSLHPKEAGLGSVRVSPTSLHPKEAGHLERSGSFPGMDYCYH